MFNMFGGGPAAYRFMQLPPSEAFFRNSGSSHAGDTSPGDVLPIEHTPGHMNRPPPMAHSGGHMFLPSSLSSPPISRPLEDCSHNNASQSMPTGSPIMRSPQPLDISMASSPLVVPHPMKATRTPKSYHCRMCDQVFDSKSEMLVHSQQVHKQDPKPYKCSTCHKSFANSSYLSQHTRIHAGVKPYKCQICERRFTQLCHLQQHIRTHTGEKPYKCQHPGCGKAFSQLSNLQSHSRSHMTDRPYRCNSCYKCFADEQSLREHIPKHSDTKHLKTHICRVCGKSYTQETYLARHMTKHSGEGTPSPRTPVMTKPVPTMPLMMMRHQGDGLDVKCEIDGTGCETMSSDVMNRPSSAFMPLAHQYANASLLNSTVPSTFTFPPPPHMPSSQLSHLSSSSSSSRYFPFDPFPKRDMMDRRLNMSREGVIADSLLSLQQIKNFATSHPVFPKSEPSSPLNKDFP